MRRAAACALTLLIVLAGASAVSAAPAANPSAGAPTRWEYTQAPTDPPYGSLVDVSCTSSTFCLAVGTVALATSTAGVQAPLAEVRGRSGWRRVPTTGLPRSIEGLGRVACERAGRCLALTDGQQPEPVWWTGHHWAVAPLPKPAHDHPVDLDCAGTACMVVGRRDDLAWSWRWSGGHWRSVPSTRAKVTYRAVSCSRATLCSAVGTRIASDGSRHAVVSRWSGRRWSLLDLPGGRYGVLNGIDCSTPTSCTAAGHINGTRGRALVETLTGHVWHASRPALPRGSNPTSISCRTSILCTAVVVWCCTRDGYPRYGFASRGTDGVWRTGPTTGSLYHALYAISCSPAACSTVGSGTVRPLAFRGPGLRPRREAVPAPRRPSSGAIFDVSCTTSGFCAAATDTADQPLVHPVGGRWQRSNGDGPSNRDRVSCSSASFCMAVLDHAARWDGNRWHPAPTPSGNGVRQVYGVDCVGPTWCDAVGVGDGFSHALIEHWDGMRWRRVATPSPDLPELDAIDCVSTTACLAVGGATVLRWDGTRWRVLDTTGLPSGDEVVDLSCWDTDACLVVYYSGRVARLDGAHFTTTPVGPGAGPRMTSVACRSADACVAVGTAGAPGQRVAVVQSWDGTQWRTVPGPSVAYTRLYSVSCSAQECWAGGYLTRNPRVSESPLLARIR